eukprot:1411229-Rhodomonas_salina.2
MKIVDRNGEKVQEYVEMEPVIIYKGSLRGSDQVFHVTILVAALSALMGRIEEVGHVMLSACIATNATGAGPADRMPMPRPRLACCTDVQNPHQHTVL